jgi:lysophospholipase L1-like esterase
MSELRVARDENIGTPKHRRDSSCNDAHLPLAGQGAFRALAMISRRKASDLLAVLISVAVAAIGLELLTRFVADDGMQFDLEMWKYARDVKQVSADPLIGHEHAPNRHAFLMGVDFRTNSRGLRDREFGDARVPGKLRILMLGDSLTVGWGVPVEDTFSKRIERLYAAEGVEAEAINLGVGNYNTTQEVESFLTAGRQYRPDIVVLNFFVNDAEELAPTKPPSALMRHCYACVFVAGRIDALTRRFFGGQDWASYYLGLYGDGSSKGWLDAKAAIKRLADYCRENNITLLVASLPELHDVAHYRFDPITDLVRAAAAQNGAAFVDVLPYLKDQPSSSLWVTAPDPHPNAFANAFIAQGLFDALRKLPAKP